MWLVGRGGSVDRLRGLCGAAWPLRLRQVHAAAHPGGHALPITPAGSSCGATRLQREDRKPTIRLTPPVVVRGSRRLAIACTNAPGSACSSRSHSREECEPVTRREDPTLCHVYWQSSRERSARQRPGRPTRTRHLSRGRVYPAYPANSVP